MNVFIMDGSIVKPFGRGVQNNLIGYAGEHGSRTFVIRTMDEISDYTVISLIIDTVDCGSMTRTRMSDGSTMLSLVLTSDIMKIPGNRMCQLMMTDGEKIMKSSQFCAYVSKSNNIEDALPDGATLTIINETITQIIGDAVNDITDASTQAVAEVNAAGRLAKESIPSDYNALNTQVRANTTDIATLNESLGAVSDMFTIVHANTTDIATLNESLGAVSNMFTISSIAIPFELVGGNDRNFIRYDTGTVISNQTYRATKYIDISKYQTITYKRTGTTASSTKAGMAFYNAEKVYISGIMSLVQQESNGYSENLYSANIPDNAVYARFTTFEDTDVYGNFELYGYTKLAEGAKNGIKLNADNAYDLNNIYTDKLIDEKTGNTSNNSLWWSTGYIKIDKDAIGYFCDTESRIAEYIDTSYTTFLNCVTNRYANVFAPQSEANYIRVSFPTGTSPAFVPLYDRKTYSIGNTVSLLANGRFSFGRENVLAMLRHMQEIKWVPTAPVPIIQRANNYNIISVGTEIIGLPYSSVRSVCKYIGLNVSLYTFMSAVQNPRSVLYTRIITTGKLGATYYGVVCGSYPAYALGFKGRFVNPFIVSQYCTEISQYEIQPGDLIIDTGDRETDSSNKHMLIITAVYYDNYGRIKKVGISEARPPLVRSLTYNYSTFLTSFGPSTQYKLYRYNDIDKCGYSNTPLVKGYPDETETDILYPDIMSEFGDMACIEAGLDVTINVINARDYKAIKIYKDNVLIDTKNNISDFVMSNIEYGLYRFDIVEESSDPNQVVDSSSSYLMVADVNGTYDPNTGMVTFSSANATPVAMQSYATETTSPGHGGVQNLEHLFTSEEIAAGEANASDIVGVQYPCVQICFATEYGTAMWYSTPLNDQWDYWSPES